MTNEELCDKMRTLAEKVGELPATGAIETKQVLPIIGEMVAVTMAAIDRGNLYRDHAAQMTSLVEGLSTENVILRKIIDMPDLRELSSHTH